MESISYDLSKYDKQDKIYFLEKCGWEQEDNAWYGHPLFPAMEDFSNENQIDELIKEFYYDLWRFTRQAIKAGDIDVS